MGIWDQEMIEDPDGMIGEASREVDQEMAQETIFREDHQEMDLGNSIDDLQETIQETYADHQETRADLRIEDHHDEIMTILEEDRQEVIVISREDHQEEAMIGTISEDHQEEIIPEMMISIEDQTAVKLEETDLHDDSLENLKMKMLEMMVEIGEEHPNQKEDKNLLLKIINLSQKNKNKLR